MYRYVVYLNDFLTVKYVFLSSIKNADIGMIANSAFSTAKEEGVPFVEVMARLGFVWQELEPIEMGVALIHT